LADLDAEMAKMQDTVAAAESRAATLENSIATAKDQLLRLNADFENFRRRAVSVVCYMGCARVCSDSASSKLLSLVLAERREGFTRRQRPGRCHSAAAAPSGQL
jgi:hypothetical protein